MAPSLQPTASNADAFTLEAGSNEDDEEITRIEDLPQEPGSCWGCCICISLFLFLYSFLLLGLGYSSDAYKARNTAEDFVSIGKRCRIEDIAYQAITSERSTDGGKAYSCDEFWDYDFVVLETEGVLEAEVDADFFGLHTVSEHRPSCGNNACSECSALVGKYALNEGQPIRNGYFAAECWRLQDGVEANSFWGCEPYYNDTSCYAISNPNEILNAHIKEPRKVVIAGWVFFGVAMFMFVIGSIAELRKA